MSHFAASSTGDELLAEPGLPDVRGARSARTGILVVTAHFPPMAGGVATFTEQFVRRLPSERVVVLAPDVPGAAAYDAAAPFPVYRYQRSLVGDLGLSRRVASLVSDHDLGFAWITAAAPLAAVAPALRKAGIARIVASSHGQELAWARLPVTRSAFAAAMRSIDVLTYLGDVTRGGLTKAIGSRAELVHLPGGVDADIYRPEIGRALIRDRHRLGERPVVVSVSRLVTRKGHDRLIDAWQRVLRAVPDAALLVVGDGSARRRLERRAAKRGHEESVIFAGTVPPNELPAHLAAGDVFALPIRDRWGGLETEGLGLAVLEASAAGLPVVVGRSGGTPSAVLDGTTGHLVDGKDTDGIADAVIGLLTDRSRAVAMGAAGRDWVKRAWSWDILAGRLTVQFEG